MIVDNLYTSLTDYGALNPKLGRAFEWLKANDLKSIPAEQTIVVDGDRITAQIQAYDSVLPKDNRYESHKVFIDIQIMVTGQEIIYWSPLTELTSVETPYNYEKDIIFYNDPEFSLPIHIREGDFTVLFPSDGHKARCVVSQTEKIKKIVMKVAI